MLKPVNEIAEQSKLSEEEKQELIDTAKKPLIHGDDIYKNKEMKTSKKPALLSGFILRGH